MQLDLAQRSASLLVRAMAILLLLLVTVVVGLFASFPAGRVVLQQFDSVVERIPGVGAVYKSFRQMSDVMLDSDTANFRDVKLVEFPRDGTYTLGFETTETPEPIQKAAGEGTSGSGSPGIRTVFMPLAPNPVMGGFLAHIPEEHIMDVDMTVEVGIRTIVTTGVGVTGGDAEMPSGLSTDQMQTLHGQQTTMANPPEDEADDQ